MDYGQNNLCYDVWLQQVLGIGNAHLLRVFETFGSAENVFRATAEQRIKSGCFSPTELQRTKTVPLSKATEILEQCCQHKITVTSFHDTAYPECLRHIYNPPAVLYSKGSLPDFSEIPTIAVVGPRHISEFGKKSAYALALRLAKAGFTIISGGALGGDTCVHKGALKAGAKTVLISACGLEHEYLSENRPLRDAILQKDGCLLSECPPNMGLYRFSFPVRNRLLSALSLGVIVVEAGEKSGCLLTAHHAAEQGKDVFVIPGNPIAPEYKGSNALLREGAKPLLDASDVFNEYIPRFPDKIDVVKAFAREEPQQKSNNFENISKKSTETLSKEAKIIYNYINKQKFTADDLLGCGLSDDLLLSALTELEIEQFISALPGGFYSVC